MKEFIQFWLHTQIKESFESGYVLVKEQMKWFDEGIYSVLVTPSNQREFRKWMCFGERINEMV